MAGTDVARINRFTFLVAIAWGFFTLSHAVAGRYLLAALHGSACVVSGVGVAIARSKISWRDRVSLPIVAGGSLVALVAIAMLTGGSDAPAMGFISLVPLVTGLHRQPVERMVWLVVSVVAIGLIPVLNAWAPPSILVHVSVAHRAVAAVGLAILLYFWGSEWRASSDAQARTIAAQAEEIEQARDRAVRASEQKSRFVAMTSHELRGPLNGILGMSHALGDTRLGDHQKELVRALSTSAESLSALLADLLDIARIEAGRLDVVLAPTEVREVLADVVDVFAPEAARKGLDIAALSDPSVPHVMDADAGRLAQVLRNLVSNAVKFTDAGSVVVEARRVGDMLEIAVTDTGKGMDEGDIGRIFAPFEQVSADLIERRAGTGLGLWISRNLVERWGGSIEVESHVGRGTTFRVRVPVGHTSTEASAGAAPPAGPVVAITRRPLVARALGSAARDAGVALDVRTSFDLDRTRRAKSVLLDFDSLESSEIDAATALGLGEGLVLAAGAGRLPECERVAGRTGARVLLLPVRARRLSNALAARDGSGETDAMTGELQGTLLVVDDDAINRRVARHAAEQLGMRVAEASSGEEALRLAKETSFDVVLLDLHLEGLGGDATAIEMRRALGASAPVLLAYTATVNETDRRRLHDAGMEDILTKPLDRSAFSAAIGRALHARRRRGRASMIPAPAALALDPGALAELTKIMGDRDAVLAMLDEFVPELDAYVGTIEAAAATGDLARVESQSHRLASSSATFGARKLAAVARNLEAASHAQNRERVRVLVGELVLAQNEAKPLLRAQHAS